jgi:hypothetical protein
MFGRNRRRSICAVPPWSLRRWSTDPLANRFSRASHESTKAVIAKGYINEYKHAAQREAGTALAQAAYFCRKRGTKSHIHEGVTR